MTLLTLKIADLRVMIEAQHSYVVKQCMPYVTTYDGETADICLSVMPDEIATAIERSQAEGRALSLGMAESQCLLWQLCQHLPNFGCLMLHAAVITDGIHTFAFTAPSGTGKTTHIRLWQQVFGKEIQVINGDKPILRKTETGFVAYGTPWCGKEGFQTNRGMPLTALCFLDRGRENIVTHLDPTQAVVPMFHQVVIPQNPDTASKAMDLLDALVRNVPLYHLTCNMEEEAACVARAGMMPCN